MLAELRDDNQRVVASMREAHGLCDEHEDVATASLLEVFIDEAERRVWFLYETSRKGDPDRALSQASQHRDRRLELGMTIRAALERGLVAAPLRHLPVLVHMRGGPGGLGVKRGRSSASASKAEPVSVVIVDTAPSRQTSAGIFARAAAIASLGCATCTTPCAKTKRAPSASLAQASTGSQCCVWRFNQAFRRMRAIAQQVRAEILRHLVGDRPGRIRHRVDHRIGKPGERHARRVDKFHLRVPLVGDFSGQRRVGAASARRIGVLTGLPSSSSGKPPPSASPTCAWV